MTIKAKFNGDVFGPLKILKSRCCFLSKQRKSSNRKVTILRNIVVTGPAREEMLKIKTRRPASTGIFFAQLQIF